MYRRGPDPPPARRRPPSRPVTPAATRDFPAPDGPITGDEDPGGEVPVQGGASLRQARPYPGDAHDTIDA
jgi:hypothetical protein